MPSFSPLPGQPDLALLCSGRVHEATGPGRRAFAAALAGRLAGPVLWVQEAREAGRLCPQGLLSFMDPARLILARPAGARAVLQVAEEALRSGAAPLVVAELAEAPDLTASRRLQLAAGTGHCRGLCLVPEGRVRANAVETRWRCAPLPGGGARQLWELIKNRRGPLGNWEVGGTEVGGTETGSPVPAPRTASGSPSPRPAPLPPA